MKYTEKEINQIREIRLSSYESWGKEVFVNGKLTVYTFADSQGRPCAIAYKGKSVKAMFANYYRSEERRQEHIEETANNVQAIEDSKAARKAEAKAEKDALKKSSKGGNIYGVKVGDLFESSWGYEQTNVNIFQVIKICGAESVRIREVYPEVEKVETMPHGMAEDISFKQSKELLPPAEHATFIKDQEKGDIKRIKDYGAEGNPRLSINLTSFASASPYNGEKLYRSWYY